MIYTCYLFPSLIKGGECVRDNGDFIWLLG